MIEGPPTRIVMYSILSGEPKPIAEFRWSPESGVTLVELDSRGSRLARDIYEHGADSYAERRMVPRSEGAAFMRALLQPNRMSYYGFVDRSGDEGSAPE